MTIPKPPTPQAISALLRKAGLACSEPIREGRIVTGYTEGHEVTNCPFEPGVLVRWWPNPEAPGKLADSRATLTRIAELISAPGWGVRLDRHELVVTAVRRYQEGETR